MTTIFLSAKPSHHICSNSRLDTKWGKNLGSLDSFSLIHIFSPFSQGRLPPRGTLCWQTNKQAFSPSGGKDDLQLKYDNNSHCFHNNKYCQHQSGNHVNYNNCQHKGSPHEKKKCFLLGIARITPPPPPPPNLGNLYHFLWTSKTTF